MNRWVKSYNSKKKGDSLIAELDSVNDLEF
jgi:hypothetical protein